MTEQAIAIKNRSESPANISSSCGFYFDVEKFAHAQRVANMFAQSSMVPEQFRGNIGNCMIALNLADRFRLDPFMVMQKMYIVHGKPGIEAQLAIALINASGRLTPLEFTITGTGDDRQCVATATKKSDGKKLIGPSVSIKMAKDEGWMGKAGSKWKTMPDLMLTYRSATFFGRIYAPEALLGFATDDEIIDIAPMKDITPKQVAPVIDIKSLSEKSDMSIYGQQKEVVEAEITDTQPDATTPNASEPSEYDKACIRHSELSQAYPREMEKVMSGRSMDSMSADEIHGVCDAVEDGAK